MANQSLPSVDGGVPSRHVLRKHPSKPTEAQEPAAVSEGYLSCRVDVKMSLKHAAILRDKQRQLEDSGAQLEDGTFVSDRTKTMLWILENEVDL
jgi:hypothetical protein